MKKLSAFTLTVLLLLCLTNNSFAQSEEARTKIQMTVVYGGKTIVSDLNAVSTSISRSYDDMPVITTSKDTAKSKLNGYYPGSLYLTLDAKKMSDDMLRVFSKKQNRFDGTITMIDTYGKNPARTIKFKQASLYSYSDQMSAGSYGDSYGASSLSFSCKELSINGILIEQ